MLDKGLKAGVLLIARGLDAEREGKFKSQCWVVLPHIEAYSAVLLDVTHVSTELRELYVHNQDVYGLPPCYKC